MIISRQSERQFDDWSLTGSSPVAGNCQHPKNRRFHKISETDAQPPNSNHRYWTKYAPPMETALPHSQ
jgi:hypothetical protein